MTLLFVVLLLGLGVLGTLYIQARTENKSLRNQIETALTVASDANRRADDEFSKRQEILDFVDKFLTRPAQVIITPEVGQQMANIVVNAILGPPVMPIEFIPKNPKPEDKK